MATRFLKALDAVAHCRRVLWQVVTRSRSHDDVDVMIPEVRVTKADLRDEAEQLARRVLGVSAAEAFRMLDRGEHSGTAFAARMYSIRYLLGEGRDSTPRDSSPVAAE